MDVHCSRAVSLLNTGAAVCFLEAPQLQEAIALSTPNFTAEPPKAPLPPHTLVQQGSHRLRSPKAGELRHGTRKESDSSNS